MSLKGKVALVTGSTSGIGLGVAEALAAAGASIMLNGFGDAERIEALRASFEPRFGVQAAEGLTPPHPTLGDVDSREKLDWYQAKKREHKAKMRAQAS